MVKPGIDLNLQGTCRCAVFYLTAVSMYWPCICLRNDTRISPVLRLLHVKAKMVIWMGEAA